MAGDNLLAATSIAPKVLYSQQLTTTTTTAIVTAAAATCVRITKATVRNVTGTAALFTLGICKNGDTAGDAHNLFKGDSIPANDTLDLSDFLADHWLGPGDFITAGSGSSSALTLVISGVIHS